MFSYCGTMALCGLLCGAAGRGPLQPTGSLARDGGASFAVCFMATNDASSELRMGG